MDTEAIDPRYRGFDTWSDAAALEAMLDSQARAIEVVRGVQDRISGAVAAALHRLQAGGRLFFAGAGSSGQLAALEAMELPATFGWPRDRVRYILPTGGHQGEEDAAAPSRRVAGEGIATGDVVLVVSASGETPFTLHLARAARKTGALVIGVCNRGEAHLWHACDLGVPLITGPEFIAGSTRLGAGTAQKVCLNLFTTLLMTRLGRVHDGLMVELPGELAKFRHRAEAIVAHVAGCGTAAAAEALSHARGQIKPAVLVAMGADVDKAFTILAQSDGHLRGAMAQLKGQGGQGS